MRTGRFLRLLLLLLLPASLGLAGGAEHRVQSETRFPQAVGPRISAPTQSLPTPVHDEATCAFCQAAIFPPCTPCTVSVPAALLETVRETVVSPDARIPHAAEARRLAESRAPPQL